MRWLARRMDATLPVILILDLLILKSKAKSFISDNYFLKKKGVKYLDPGIISSLFGFFSRRHFLGGGGGGSCTVR